ncbi:MAG: DUF2807 domain-containing protein [Saprospiraceae bacterium]|nr:DUF2807 domain-containing protein [Saprospiraceae bacterium]MBK8514500.1 DUF2807 domain-containing protein [Saprospiraceae bacterium]MBL0109383.1 DUF2807 domain-containing protein [Saprospiraceae bacterium]
MKKIYLFVVLALISVLSFSSCEKIEGHGPIISEIRNRTGFEGLRVSVCGQINFQVSPLYKVEVLAQANILDELETKVDGAALEIKWSHPLRVRNCEDITINISGPKLRFISNSGSSDIQVLGFVSHPTMELTSSGSGSINIDQIEISDELEAKISGSGQIFIASGLADRSTLYVSGSGEMDLSQVETAINNSHISGSGNVTVKVSEYLEAHISGSGDVYYYGRPRIETKISGSGRVKGL